MAYVNVYRQEQEGKKVFCYRSGLTVYEEVLEDGCLAASGWNAAGYPLDVLKNYPSRLKKEEFWQPGAFRMEAGGIELDGGWEFAGFEEQKKQDNLHCILTLDNRNAPIRAYIHTELDGTGMLTRQVETENLSGDFLPVSHPVLFGGALEKMNLKELPEVSDRSKLYSVGYFDYTLWGHEGQFAWHDLQAGTMCIDTRFAGDRHRHPVCFIRNNLLGTVWAFQMAWSGGCRLRVDYRSEMEKEVLLTVDSEVTGFAPQLVLKPGERFMFPAVHAGLWHGGLDDAVNGMHMHVRKSVLNRPEADGKELLIGCGMGAEHCMDLETTKAFVRQFSQMGGEVFILDAGWECPLTFPIEWVAYNGENVPNADRYPDSFRELKEECARCGMKFGLWVEIERLGEKSGVHAAHPEWRAKDRYGKQSARYLDLTMPEAYAWAKAELERIIREYGLELLRVDYNMRSPEYFAMRDIQDCGIREDISLRQFNAVYRLYGELKKEFPDVIFENCAGGGGRTDLGQMAAFNHTWVSDWQNAPRALTITNGMTMALPPERVDRLFAGMGSHRYASIGTQMRNTMLGHMSLNVISPVEAEIDPEAMEVVQRSVRLYKEFIRPILPSCFVYHPTPEAAECQRNGFSVLEAALPDGTKGAATVFSYPMNGHDEVKVKLRGIRAGKKYRIYLDNTQESFEADGFTLSQDGLKVTIPSALGSELILYSESSGS